jgi:hypothetical protein
MRREQQTQVIAIFVVAYMLSQIALIQFNVVDYGGAIRAIGHQITQVNAQFTADAGDAPSVISDELIGE